MSRPAIINAYEMGRILTRATGLKKAPSSQSIRKFEQLNEVSDSECVQAINYDLESQTLQIIFNERGTYEYSNFPADEYAIFAAASSLGQYFNLYIRNSGYSFRRID